MRCDWLLAVAVLVVTGTWAARAELLPNGVFDDEQTSIVYYPETGGIEIGSPASTGATSFSIASATCIFTRDPPVDSGSLDDPLGNCVIFYAPISEPASLLLALLGFVGLLHWRR